MGQFECFTEINGIPFISFGTLFIPITNSSSLKLPSHSYESSNENEWVAKGIRNPIDSVGHSYL